MQDLRNILKGVADGVAIVIGAMTLAFLFACPESELLNTLVQIAAVGCALYVAYALYLLCRRPQFDWHLLNGRYLRKVVCLVLLVPSLLTCIIQQNILLPDVSVVHAEEFVSDDGLYEPRETDSSEKLSNPPLLWGVYYHFVDPGNLNSTSTANSRTWAGLISILGVFLLNGLLVSSIIGWVDSRKEKWQKGEVCYRWFLTLLNLKGHYVIIGGNDMVGALVEQLLAKIDKEHSIVKPYILIQTSQEVEHFRRELFSSLTERQQQRIIIYYGNRNADEDMKELCLCRAREVYILGEETRTDDLESYHDTMNMECLRMMGEELRKTNPLCRRKDRLKCRVLFEYQTTFSVFQFFDTDKTLSSIIDFRPFNYYELLAQRVFVNSEIDSEALTAKALAGDFLPLEGCRGLHKDDEEYVHLFVVGMSRMGVAMAVEAAHLAHYPNYTEQKKIRTKITFVDKNAAEEKAFFMGRFKELFELSHWRYGDAENKCGLTWLESYAPSGYDYLGGDFIDVEWEFINGGIEQTVVQNYILQVAGNGARTTIAICLPESNRSHAAAMYLHKGIYESESVQQVLVYNRYGDSIIKALSSDELHSPYLNKLKAFGAPRDCFNLAWLEQSERIGESIGSKYNEINEQYILPAKRKAGQMDTADKPAVKYKGKSQVAKFWSNIYNGNTMWAKLRSVDYKSGALTPAQIAMLSDVEHNRWTIEQLLMNFRPLTLAEQQAVLDGVADKEELKSRMAHLDICSNRRLAELLCVDVAARAYDEGLTALLPTLFNDCK